MIGKDTISEDIVGRKLLDSTKGVIAKDNAKALAAMTSGITVQTYTNGSSAYKAVVDATVKFNKDNKVVFTNATQGVAENDTNQTAKGGWQASTVIVGSSFYGKLQKCEEFIKATNTDFSVNEAVVGRVAGLTVVYAQDMDETNYEFIVMSPDGFLAPKGVSATEVFGQVEGYPGAALVQAEMVYGYKVLDSAQIAPWKEANA